MANPLDAHRKQQRKKELKKNKENRKKTREVITVKKDTRPLESDIAKLTSAAQRGPLSSSDREELNSLKAELARITKAKTEYLEAHPEHRKFVFPDRGGSNNASGSGSGGGGGDPPGLYGKDGKLKDPQRSYYYDPVFNPFGAPPPGMPYRERDPTAEEIAAFQKQLEDQHRQMMMTEEESEDDSDDDDEEDGEDIVMPAGPPPPKGDVPPNEEDSDDSSSDDKDDDDDIAMPDGPPPPKPGSSKRESPSSPSCSPRAILTPPHPLAIPTGPKSSLISRPSNPLPPNPNFHPHQQNRPPFPPHQHHQRPPQPFHPDPALRNLPPRPSAPMGAPTGPRQQQHHQGQGQGQVRPPPNGVGGGMVQDPLSDTPQQTFQGYLQARQQQNVPNPNQISIGSGPNLSTGEAQPASFFVGPSSSTNSSSSTTITAAPVIRDLKKEATAFIPSNMRKKKGAAAAASGSTTRQVVNAAPGMEGDGAEKVERADLLGALKDRGIGGVGGEKKGKSKAEESKEDYERFKKEMGEFL